MELKTKVINFIINGFKVASHFGVSAGLAILSIVILKLGEPLAMNLGIFGSIAVTSIFFYVCKLYKKTSTVILFTVITVILSQVVLVASSPLHSLIPTKILISSGLLKPLLVANKCDEETNYKTAISFYGNNIDPTKVKIYRLSDSKVLNYIAHGKQKISANALGNFIYINSETPCATKSILVHELAHVWQYQHGQGFGINWIPKWIHYYWTYYTNFDSLYDYKGIEGLLEAKEKGKTLTDFTIEQQARIIEHYYLFRETYNEYAKYKLEIPDNESYRLYKLLKYFVETKLNNL